MAKQTTDGIDPDDPDTLDAMADRLEAALDRIVRRLDTPPPIAAPPGVLANHLAARTQMTELAARLDGLIARLRGVLGEPPGRPEH
jgi:hypothetical protein